MTIRGSGPVAFGQGVATSTIEASTTLQLTVAPAPDFALSVNPSSATIEQGQSRSDLAVSVARTAFDGPVTLGLTGDVPNGVTAGFAPAAPTNGSSVLSIAVDAATPTGTYALAISGNGAPGARTVPFTLTVAPAPPPAGTFTLSMPAPCAQNFRLRQGAIDDRRLVVIERDNLPNAIQFSVEGLPAGVTTNFDANPVTGNSVRIIFIAASDATPGNHPVTLRGIVPGGNPVTLPFMIEVHEVDPFEDDLDATNFDFTGGSTGGWRRGVVCPEGNDDFGGVILQDDMIVMGGRGPASGRTEPNAWMTRLVRLPANATVFRFDASAHHIAFCGNFCRTRVRVRVFEGTTSTTLLDETIEWIAEGLVFEPYNADVSPWAGKVVRLIIEHLDPDASHVQLWLDTFRIL